MDFNLTHQQALHHQLGQLLQGIQYCHTQVQHGWDAPYHQQLQTTRMQQYRQLLQQALAPLGGNAVVIGDLPNLIIR